MKRLNAFVVRTFTLLVLLAVVFFSSNLHVFAVGEPVVVNDVVSNILTTSATLNGEVTDEGSAPIIGLWVEYGLDTNYGTEIQLNFPPELQAAMPGAFSQDISGLTCDTEYHYRLRARNNALLDGYSSDATFTTLDCDTVSRWSLNESSGTRSDSIGDNDLNDTNTVVATTGQFDGAAEFSTGDSNYLSIDDNASMSTGGTTNFTISAWVKLNAKSGTQVFVSKYSASGNGEYALYYELIDDRFMFSTYGLGGGNRAVTANTFGSPNTGVWYHLTGTHNAVDGINTITVDGVADSISDVPEHADSNGPFVIGAFGPTPVFFADAVVDEVVFSKTETIPSGEGFAGGDGTEETPYQIGSCGALALVNDNLSAFYVLTSDLDCTASGNNILIGTGENPFTGDFDGDDYTITVAINLDEDRVGGLFREIDGAAIRHLNIAGTVAGGDEYTGGMIGYSIDSDIISSSSSADVTGGNYDIGGLVGHFESGTIEESSATGDVSATDETPENMGGLVGHTEENGNIISSFADGDITGFNFIGGLVGYVEDSNITDSHATGEVTGVQSTGGLVGYFEGSTFSTLFQSYATGTVTGTNNTGGLVGSAYDGIISQSYATGTVTGQEAPIEGFDLENVGGFIGTTENVSIRDSYARGNVVSDGINFAGGFIGELDEGAQIISSYSTGSVTGDDTQGGFAGNVDDDSGIFFSAWDKESSGLTAGCGIGSCHATGKTTTQMKTSSTFADLNWNLDTIWDLLGGTNDGYPYLLGGDDETIDTSTLDGPVETILDESQFHGGGEAQGWNEDDGHWEYNLPFPFYFYGHFYETVYVNSNGYISFLDQGRIDAYDVAVDRGLGTPSIFALGNDLLTYENEGDDIYITESPSQVIFRWQATDYDNHDSISNFEIVLHKNHRFEINYGNQTEEINDSSAVGVHDGIRSYETSAYDLRTDFDELNTSAWEWQRVPTRRASVGGYASTAYLEKQGIKLENARPTVKKGDLCPADQILTQNLKAPSQNGKYHPYTKAIVTEAKILQGHLARLGFNPGPVDGFLGPLSDGAIKRMQTFLKTTPDGYVGPVTRGVLNNSCGTKTP